jgi:hypothetical protein
LGQLFTGFPVAQVLAIGRPLDGFELGILQLFGQIGIDRLAGNVRRGASLVDVLGSNH